MPISYGPETTWPPVDVAEAAPYYAEWLTWWRGKPEQLAKFYRTFGAYGHTLPPSQRGGLGGAISAGWNRLWWGRESVVTGPTRLHVPAAADVSSISAALLFADPPALTVPVPKRSSVAAGGGLLVKISPAQEALDRILEDAKVYTVLHAAAEKGSAAGGVYLRASANAALAPVPITESILPDCAVPEWYGPFLIAVTFWRRLERDRGPAVRHLERHEMVNGVCVIEHATFEGTDSKLGRRTSLADYPETGRLSGIVDGDGRVLIGTTMLDVVYVPNIQPHRSIEGTELGRSDYAGAEGEMDSLDETWSSWMRDIRLGKGRLIVPKGYIRRGSAGEGGFFDPEQEIFTAVNAQPGNADSAKLSITMAQFTIRVAEHDQTTRELWRIILKNAGLDGTENDTSNAPETATKTNDKASRKRGTRSVKMRYWTPALRQLAQVLLELNAMIYGGPAAEPVSVEWPDASAPDMETQARTLQLLDAAGAVSTQTKIEILHPDWDETEVTEEVTRIAGDAPAPPDPADPNAAADPFGNAQPVDNPVDDSGQPA